MYLMKFIRYFVFCLISGAAALSFFAAPLIQVRAETTQEVEARRAKLQAELEAEEKAIAVQTAILQAKQKETATVQGELNLLKSQIKQAETNIRAKKVEISRLDSDIAVREGKISALDAEIKREQDSLAELLRKSRDFDSSSLTEIILDNQHLSDFFDELDSIDSVQQSIHQSFARLRGAQDEYEREKVALAAKKDKELDAKAAIETQQKVIAKKESEKAVVLSINKNQEQAYQKVLAERQKKAAQIRAELFGLRDSAAIPFGKALEYALGAYNKTGIRPAFLLAILKQESNLGENVGSCLLSSIETGDGVGKNTGTFFEKVMAPSRKGDVNRGDTVPFLSITSRLGRDWKTTPVSCPIGGTKYYVGRGFGGAMGPAQFIPSTWELMKNKVGSFLGLGGDSIDPWNPQHAFMASATYLADLGAGGGAYSSEIKAACKYYGSGGTTCVYGKQVMAKAQDIQLNMIDLLQEN